MRAIFIADAHLRRESDENYRRLLSFLQGLESRIDTLFILGDLFEFWIGYRENPFSHYEPVLDGLRRLVASGVRIVYFEGNHDFHLGPVFTEALRARVQPGPAVVELDGRRVYLCHGDQVNRRDYGSRLLRFILHNRLTAAIVPLVPPSWAQAIADRMSRESRARHGMREQRWDYAAILRQFAADRFREGCDTVICGHFHLPLLESPPDSGGTLLSLGDWISQYSYGEWENGRLTLKTYP